MPLLLIEPIAIMTLLLPLLLFELETLMTLMTIRVYYCDYYNGEILFALLLLSQKQ